MGLLIAAVIIAVLVSSMRSLVRRLLDGIDDGTSTAGGAAPLDIVTFDGPFLFLLTDTQTRSPLFMPVVNNPST